MTIMSLRCQVSAHRLPLVAIAAGLFIIGAGAAWLGADRADPAPRAYEAGGIPNAVSEPKAPRRGATDMSAPVVSGGGAFEDRFAREPAAALTWAESHLQGARRVKTMARAVDEWVAIDADAAARWVTGMADDAAQLVVAESLMRSWGSRDGRAAARFLAGEPTGWRSDPLILESFAAAWARIDPAAATRWAVDQFGRDGSSAAFQRTVGEWASRDPQEAVRAVREAPAELKFFGAASLAFHWARQAPEEAADWARTLGDAQIRSTAVAQAINAWAQSAPGSAATWLMANADAQAQSEAVSPLVGQWTDSDAPGASAWVAALPAGSLRDQAAAELGIGLHSHNPALALDWIQRIGDGELRQLHTEELVSEWLLRDRPNAETWLSQASIAPELKASLLADDPLGTVPGDPAGAGETVPEHSNDPSRSE